MLSERDLDVLRAEGQRAYEDFFGSQETRHLLQTKGILNTQPRVHGNGFIQLDLEPDGSRRLHIWGHPAIPRQSVASPIHDHIFGMHSEVLVGRIFNTMWRALPPRHREPTHKTYEAFYTSPTSSSLADVNCPVYVHVDRVFAKGGLCSDSSYIVPAGELHSSLPDGPCATLMTKIRVERLRLPRPRVLVPIGSEPDNSFDRNAYQPALLWGIINEVYPLWHKTLLP